MLPESEFVTAGTPFFTTLLLELCELIGTDDSVEKEENDVFGAIVVAARATEGAGGGGRVGFAGKGILTASCMRIRVGVACEVGVDCEDRCELGADVEAAVSSLVSAAFTRFPGDCLTGVELPEFNLLRRRVSRCNLVGLA